MRRLLLLCTMTFLALAAAPAAGAQELMARFEITAVSDTSFTFRPAGYGWVERGVRGIAVDPRRRDVMVARFHVVSVRDGLATAVITGQTTTIGTEHMALIPPPSRRWYERREFWLGTVLGTAIGAAIGSAL